MLLASILCSLSGRPVYSFPLVSYLVSYIVRLFLCRPQPSKTLLSVGFSPHFLHFFRSSLWLFSATLSSGVTLSCQRPAFSYPSLAYP
jgi:hypothetical protein